MTCDGLLTKNVSLKLSRDLLPADCQNLLSTGRLQVFSTSCNKFENYKLQQESLLQLVCKLHQAGYIYKIYNLQQRMCVCFTMLIVFSPIVVCPLLDHPTNGIRRGSHFEGDIVSFFCKFQYTLTGNENLQCLSDGTWNGSPPTCMYMVRDNALFMAGGGLVRM